MISSHFGTPPRTTTELGKTHQTLGGAWRVSRDSSEISGRMSNVYLDPPRGAEWMGKGAIQNTTHWRVLVLLFSLLFNFSGVVLKTFREASLILGGEEDPKNHSTASNHSNS